MALKHEWLQDGNFIPDINLFNSRLKEFLIEYNSVRPHQSLEYLTPIEFAVEYKQLSERYPSSTRGQSKKVSDTQGGVRHQIIRQE